MKNKYLFALSPLALAMGINAPALAENAAEKAQSDEEQVENILIVGKRYNRVSKGATGLAMEISETPQSISVLSSEQYGKFAAHNLNDALRLANGVTVEAWETNRTNYSSRGFEIKNTQVDGIGLPNNWGIVKGAMESYGYERIEVIRGANGLLTGVGNSSGTLNFVRKRPTNENQGEIGVSVGSYSFKRLQADASVVLTDDGSWAARFVAAAEDKNSHLKALESNRNYFYGVVDGQLTDSSTLTLGYSYQDDNSDGNTWGGLVLNYTDGTQAEWDRSATTAQEWTMWDNTNKTAFVEFTTLFSNDWEMKLSYNHRSFEDDNKLFYAFTRTGIDKATGLGLAGLPGRYPGKTDHDLFELSLDGDFSLFGREHKALIGISTAKSDAVGYRREANPPFVGLPPFPYPINSIAEPVWAAPTLNTDIEQKLTRIYASAQLNVLDELKAIVGFNSIKYKREGVSNRGQVTINNEESEISPYFGLTYSFSEDLNFYASYSDIYQPQEQYDINRQFLEPTKGVNVEAGVKSEFFDDRLLMTFAVFSAKQENLANQVGIDTLGVYYAGIDVKSKGAEFEAVGKVTDNLNLNFAYTYIDVKGVSDATASTWVPDNTVNLILDYTLPEFEDITVGVGARWQSEVKNSTYNITQGSYAILNAFVSWQATEQLSVQLNLKNITDEKYLTSVQNVGYYAAPFNGSVSVNYSF